MRRPIERFTETKHLDDIRDRWLRDALKAHVAAAAARGEGLKAALASFRDPQGKALRHVRTLKPMEDATLVAIAEHGLVPSVQASRMTLAAAPDAIQGAVSAGILGCVLALLALGLLIQASHASTTVPPELFPDELRGLLVYRIAGLGVLLVAMRIGPRRLSPYVPSQPISTRVYLEYGAARLSSLLH